MQWVKVPGHLTEIWHRHRPAKVLPQWHPSFDYGEWQKLPPVMEASALPPAHIELNLAENGMLVHYCPQCDIQFYNNEWWYIGLDNSKIAQGLKKRFAGVDVPKGELVSA